MKIDNQTLLLLDFDGTILKTDKFNWECYCIILKKYKKEINYIDFLNCINNGSFEIFLEEKLGLSFKEINDIKNEKFKLMPKQIEITKNLNFIKGIPKFLKNMKLNNIPHCVVTNTADDIIDLYKNKFPELNYIKNWITRKDYKIPKPNSECYQLAIKKYKTSYINKIFGFEDSWVGYLSLKDIDNCYIYIIENECKINEDKFLKENVNIIQNYNIFI
uniref:Haloacid dehalogenase-like hydrolase n=1 Tax=Mimiviridae sp. ChoanoV1 TaxID=2596887 RepID=A0A5B8IFD3_9VIRU|nr:hypothetical protein 1_32 [Mimiviridae sp. ChoanoV1]